MDFKQFELILVYVPLQNSSNCVQTLANLYSKTFAYAHIGTKFVKEETNIWKNLIMSDEV